MDPNTLVALILGVINVGLTMTLAIRKESKEEAKRREDACRAREKQLEERLEHCDRERNMQLLKLAVLEAKQQMWDALLPQFKLMMPITGGKRHGDPQT